MSSGLRIPENVTGPLGSGGVSRTPRPRGAQQPGAPSFVEALQSARGKQAGELRFSAHAQTRIESRRIPLNADDMSRIEDAVRMAATKGSRESLVLLDQAAFVVSVPNRTVITVVDKENLKQNVFTNIDSAVIA